MRGTRNPSALQKSEDHFFSTFEFQQIGYRYRKLKMWDTNGFAKWVIFGSFIIHSQGIYFFEPPTKNAEQLKDTTFFAPSDQKLERNMNMHHQYHQLSVVLR